MVYKLVEAKFMVGESSDFLCRFSQSFHRSRLIIAESSRNNVDMRIFDSVNGHMRIEGKASFNFF